MLKIAANITDLDHKLGKNFTQLSNLSKRKFPTEKLLILNLGI